MPKSNVVDQIKNTKLYETLREQGVSKQKAVRIANYSGGAAVKIRNTPKYEEWTLKELQQKGRELGIEKYLIMNKLELIYTLRNS